MDSFRNFAYVSSYLHCNFCMEGKLSNNFETTDVTKLTKAILEISYRVLQVTSKWKTLKQPVCFLRAVESWTTFDIQIDITLDIFWEMLRNHNFYKAHRCLSKSANIHVNGAYYCEIIALQKSEKCLIFGSSFKEKSCWHFRFLMNQIFG